MAEATLGADVKAAFGIAVFLTVVACLIDNGILGWAVALIVLPLLFYSMAKAPLRHSLLVLMFCALTLENPSEQPAAGMWKSPLFSLGGLMLTHLKQTVGGGLFFSGMDIMLAFLGVIVYTRRSSRSNIDRIGHFAVPRPMIQVAYLALGGMAFVWMVGLIRGGADSSMAVWQLDRVMYVPLTFLLFQAGLRGPQDAPAVGKVILLAGACRALQARYVVATVIAKPDPETGSTALVYATTHHDSMLFAWTTVLVVAMLVHRMRGGTGKLALVMLPILVSGMLANNRRMVWVQIILVFITLYFLTGMNAVKRKIQRTLRIVSPIALLYVLIGWNAGGSAVFKPVRIIRSAVDSKSDASTQWRDIENYDLLYTIRQFPFFGTGYGKGFWEVQPLPAVDYQLERFIPHNSILGLWTYCGYFGYTAITLLWVIGVYFAIRAYHAASSPVDKTAALVCFAGLLIHFVQCYGDMGLGSWSAVFMVAPSLAMAGKLAVANGQWPSGNRLPARKPARVGQPLT
ncbi:MAG: hypothetical protein WDO69_29325 [Pseudomonadota bacterium]